MKDREYILNKIENGPINGSIFKKLQKDKEFFDFIQNYTKELLADTKFSVRVFYWIFKIKENPKCSICGKNLNFDIPRRKFQKFCSRKCKDEYYSTIGKKDLISKRKKTNLLKYGVEYPTQNDDIKEKRKKTCLEKYGVTCTLQEKKTKNKTKRNNLKKYGTEYPIQNNDIKEKSLLTTLKKYGVKNNFQIKSLRKKARKTCFNKYGYETPLESEKIRNKIKRNNLKKYGVEYPIQNDKIKEKIFRLTLHNSKNYILPSNKKINIQGYENRFLNWYFTQKFNENDLKIGYECEKFHYYLNNKKHLYFPDFQLKSTGEIIEIKSFYTLYKELSKNVHKFDSVIKKGRKIKIYIFDNEFKPTIINYKNSDSIKI